MPLQGRYVDALDNENKLLYPKTAAAQVVYSPNKSVRKKIDEIDDSIREINVNVKTVTDEVKEARDDDTTIHLTLKKRLDSMRDKTSKVENEVKEAREKDGVIYDNLSDRLKMTDAELGDLQIEIEDARGDKQTLSEKLTSLSDGNKLTLDEVIEARNGEAKLDVRLDKMQDNITTVSNQITQAMSDDLGTVYANLKTRLDRMRVETERVDNEVIEARKSIKYPNNNFATLKDRLDAMDNDITNVVGGNFLSTTGGTMTGDIILGNNISVNGLGTDGIEKNIIQVSNDNKVYIGDEDTPLVLSSSIDPVYHNATTGDEHKIWHEGNFNPADKRDNLPPRLGANWQGTPLINGDGVMEIGKYIDFHNSHNGQTDYDVRLSCTGNALDVVGTLRVGNNLGITGETYAANNIILDNNKGLGGKETGGATRWIGYVNPSNQMVLGDNNIVTNLQGSQVRIDNNLYFRNQAGINMKDTGGTDRDVLYVDNQNRFYVGHPNVPTVLRGDTISSQKTINVTGDVNATGMFIANSNYSNTFNAFQANRTIDGRRIHAKFGASSEGFSNSGATTSPSGVIEISTEGDGNPNLTRYVFSQHGFAMSGARSGALNLGDSGNRYWNAVFARNGVIQTSDMRNKSDIRDIDDTILYNIIKNTGVHSYVLNYPDMPEDIKQEDAPQEQIHVGVIAQELQQNTGWQYILNEYTNEDGETELSINNYNYTSAIHGAVKILIGKNDGLEYEVKTLKTKLSTETNKRKELEKEFKEFKELVSQKLGTI